MSLIIGIDPGLHGGLAAIRMSDAQAVYISSMNNFIEIQRYKLLVTLRPDIKHVFLERIDGNAKLSRDAGLWEGMLIGLKICYTLVRPKKWQSYLNCSTNGDKNVTKELALKIFRAQEKKVTHDTADSLLIAYYGWLRFQEALLKKACPVVNPPESLKPNKK